MHRKVCIITFLLILPVLALLGVNTLLAKIAGQGPIGPTVVGVKAYHCQAGADALCAETKTGSGVIVDSRGLILTAYAVVSATQGLADDFEIVLSQGTVQRYRAALIEIWPDKDLALLLIYYDAAKQLVINQDLTWTPATHSFPTAQINADANDTDGDGEIVWWSIDQLAQVTTPALLDQATGRLSISADAGMLGAPVVVQNQVVGLITNASPGTALQVQWVAQMRNLAWQPNTPRAWLEDLQIARQDMTGTATVTITATIHALDQIAKPLALLVYFFDEQRRPLADTVHRTYEPQHFVDVQTVVLTASLANPGVDPAKLRLRFLVWDVAGERVLWRDRGWYTLPAPSASAAPVPPTPTLAPTSTTPPKVCPEGMELVKGEDGGFCMDIHEVTNAAYAECKTCLPPQNVNTRNRQPYYGNSTFNNYPVIGVTWFQAEQYCRGVNKSLPTAQQWQLAAAMVENRSAVVEQVITFRDTMSVTVNAQDRSTNGIYDLIGNVREWASDNSPEAASKKNVMGLSYVDDTFPPDSELPDQARMDIGLRCVQ